MITEKRQILFSNDALREAVRHVASVMPDKVPHGMIRRVWLSEEPELLLFVQVEPLGARKLYEVSFRHSEIAAFLILFCRKLKVPLPRTAEKYLEVEGGNLSLVITKQIPVEGSKG